MSMESLPWRPTPPKLPRYAELADSKGLVDEFKLFWYSVRQLLSCGYSGLGAIACSEGAGAALLTTLLCARGSLG